MGEEKRTDDEIYGIKKVLIVHLTESVLSLKYIIERYPLFYAEINPEGIL